jgi:uncharacterized membrane protein YdbT with pleckstrin-like domain
MQRDERIIFQGHPSRRAIAGLYLQGAVLALAAGGITAIVTRIVGGAVSHGWVAVAGIGVMAVAIALGELWRRAATYTVTTHRVRARRGLIRRSTREAWLSDVRHVRTQQSLAERLLRIGAVTFDVRDGRAPVVVFRGVTHPRGVRRAVDEARRPAGR